MGGACVNAPTNSHDRWQRVTALCVERNVGGVACAVLNYLLRRENFETRECWPAQETIARETRWKVRAVQLALHELQRHGLIEIVKVPKAGGGGRSHYRLVDTATLPATTHVVHDAPDAGCPPDDAHPVPDAGCTVHDVQVAPCTTCVRTVQKNCSSELPNSSSSTSLRSVSEEPATSDPRNEHPNAVPEEQLAATSVRPSGQLTLLQTPAAVRPAPTKPKRASTAIASKRSKVPKAERKIPFTVEEFVDAVVGAVRESIRDHDRTPAEKPPGPAIAGTLARLAKSYPDLVLTDVGLAIRFAVATEGYRWRTKPFAWAEILRGFEMWRAGALKTPREQWGATANTPGTQQTQQTRQRATRALVVPMPDGYFDQDGGSL